jgi:hypothetical protein
MPTVRYNGPSFYRRSPDAYTPDFSRGEVRYLVLPYFTLDGDEAPHVDEGNDGIPDSSWRRGAIAAWLTDNGVDLSGSYRTKGTLLTMVDEVLNPPAPEPEPVPEPPVVEEEVVVEEPVVEETATEETTETITE